MDYVVLVTVVLAFWTTDVQSQVATGPAMPPANSCRTAGKAGRNLSVARTSLQDKRALLLPTTD